MNIEDFKKYVKAHPLYAYLRENDIIDDVEELIKNSEDLTFLNERYNEYVLKMNKEREAQSKCDSDFFWWGHEADAEKYKYLSEFVEYLKITSKTDETIELLESIKKGD